MSQETIESPEERLTHQRPFPALVMEVFEDRIYANQVPMEIFALIHEAIEPHYKMYKSFHRNPQAFSTVIAQFHGFPFRDEQVNSIAKLIDAVEKTGVYSLQSIAEHSRDERDMMRLIFSPRGNIELVPSSGVVHARSPFLN